MSQPPDHFYLSNPEPNQGCLLALRSIILEQDDEISETRKYSMPCFCYRNKAFCYLWVDKKLQEPYVLFVEGKNMDHPELEMGSRSRMKILRVDPNKDIPLQTLVFLLNMALDLCKGKMIKLK